MIYSYKRFRKLHRTSTRSKVASLIVCVLAAPFVLVFLYTLTMACIGGLWFLMSKLGDADLLMPYAFTGLAIAALYWCWESRRTQKLFRKYLAGQPLDELSKVSMAPDGEYSKLDRRLAADAAHESARQDHIAERTL